MGFWDDVGSVFGVGSGDPSNQYRNALAGAAGQQAQFGQGLQGQYMQNQAGIANTMGMLQGLASGQNSVSAEQLRQGLQQAQAQQMSMAASATPQNQAMAARNAMMNAGNVASGMMGQQAMAGLQERQAALNALSQMQMQQSGQNLQGALGMGQMSNAAYGTDLQNPQKTWGNIVGGALGGLAGGFGAGLGGGIGRGLFGGGGGGGGGGAGGGGGGGYGGSMMGGLGGGFAGGALAPSNPYGYTPDHG